MKLPVQITFHHIDASNALETEIRSRDAKLDQFHPHVLSCRVVVTGEANRKQQGNPFSLRLDIKVKGHEFAITRSGSHEDPFVAVRDAFDAARRQIEALAQEMRGEVKTHVK